MYTIIKQQEGENKMQKSNYCKITKQNDTNYVIFPSINNIVNFNRNTPQTEKMASFNQSQAEGFQRTEFSGTTSYKEAESLLLHGWEDVSCELTKCLNATNTGFKTVSKNFYSPVGYQPCVPRYLKGLPDSMIQRKKVQQKQKVLNIIKSICYPSYVRTETIKEESLKVLKLIQSLEAKGYRCNLYIVDGIDKSRNVSEQTLIYLKIKESKQRLNVKQVAFPLVHPSMLRRIFFGVTERLESTKNIGRGYGTVLDEVSVKHKTKQIIKNTIVLPPIIKENEITNIEIYS